ncbi:hypothetical protein L6164_030716 [Bauhinia variegata]|uniref:Uncharacterized protein n=1 Tax=Bauhinia variegata TaxID=167791 RepID=A0ACB9LCL0_BAUVA|nr:hypothetical protein L6164_030716 [Bauhinia variegata]
MAFNQRFWLSSALILTVALSVYSFPPTFISDAVLDSQQHIGRSLLQAKKGCPVNFEFLNYTIITSKCKGPHYINLYGKYPPGLFASECREGKEGLECPALPPSTSTNDTANQIMHCPSLLLMLTAGFLVLFFR